MEHDCCCGEQVKNRSHGRDTCSTCDKMAELVKSYTVKHLVVEELVEEVGDSDYRPCMNEDCDVAYYSCDSGTIFNKRHVRVPIWFKRDAYPKYACYCSRVTEEEVIKAVIKKAQKT